MEALLGQLISRTADTQLIFNLFHLLLAGLALVVLLYQLRAGRAESTGTADRLLPSGFFLLVLHYGLLTLRLAVEFFLHKEFQWPGFEGVSHGLMACGLTLVVAGYLAAWSEQESRLARWTLRGLGLVAGLAAIDLLVPFPSWAPAERSHSAPVLLIDLLALLTVGLGLRGVTRAEREGRWAELIALACAGASLVFHCGAVFLPDLIGLLAWNAEQHLLSVSLFAFAWAAGNRSGNLLDRVFVCLNLTFILLASLIMLVTTGMEKYHYLRLAEERSMNLAEFLRGHIVYYRGRGEGLAGIFEHREVLRRVVTEFGTLSELREVDVYLEGQATRFWKTPDWEIKQQIMSPAGRELPPADAQPANRFRMIRLPIDEGTRPGNRIEFLGTTDYMNHYVGKYIVVIYSLFTVIVGLATGIIGIIVVDTQRRLRQQYAELQHTHQQLAQAAKLASVGELAAGMAHEINNPITSILSLASHMAEEKHAATLTPRQRSSLQVVQQQAERVSKIVRNLLTFSRRARLELGQVDVRQVLDTATTLVQYRLRESGIDLRCEIDANLPHVLGDAGRLAEVFVNLLSNAIDAMPSGGTLTLQASRAADADGEVCVKVQDTGCGMPSQQLSRIFDPFFTTKEPGRGTGLGLSICHGIVKDHGGQIWAESQPGAGTALIITLPKEGS